MEEESKLYNPNLLDSLLEKEAEENLVLKTEPKQIFQDESLTQHILWIPPNVKNIEERRWVNLAFSYFRKTLSALKTLIGHSFNYSNDTEHSTTLQANNQNESLNRRLQPNGIQNADDGNIQFERKSRLSSRLDRDGFKIDFKEEEENDAPEITKESEVQSTSRHDANDFIWRRAEGINTASGVIISISIRQLAFERHPFMVKEERLATRLQCLHHQYEEIENEFLRNETLQKIVYSLKEMSNKEREHVNSSIANGSAKAKENEASLVEDVMIQIAQIAQDEQQLLNIYIMILQVWGELLSEREKQGFKSTSVTLSKETYTHECKDVIDRVAGVLEPPTNNDDKCEALGFFRKFLQIIKDSRNRRYELILFNNCDSRNRVIIDRSMQASERRRRRRLESESYFAKLLVNGRLLGQTQVAQMNSSSFTVLFNSKFRCLVPHDSSYVCVELYRRQVKGLLPNHLIATIYVQVDNTDATKWYCFNEAGDQLKGYMVLSVHTEATSEPVKNDCMCVPIENNGFRLKHARLIQSAPNTLNVANTKTKNLSFDSDTMALSARASIAHHTMSFKLRGTKTSFLNYFMIQESIRHLLIKDRYMKLSRYHDRIQLDEYEAFKETEHIAIGNERGQIDIENLLSSLTEERIIVNTNNLMSHLKRLRTIKRISDSEKVRVQTCYEDVIQDMAMIKSQSPPPDLEWILKKLCPPRRRSLYPMQPSIKLEDRGIAHTDRRLIITVISASNTPNRVDVIKPFVTPYLTSPSVRRGTDATSTPTRMSTEVSQKWNDTERDETSPSPANFFLQIHFQGRVHQLSFNNSLSSSLKHVLEIPLRDSSTNFTPLWLKGVMEPINITMFDQVEVNIGTGGGYYEDENTTCEESRFIGNANVQLCAIYEGGKVEGSIPLVEPSFIIGYEKTGAKLSTLLDVERQDTNAAEGADNGKEKRYNENEIKTTSLNVLFSIDPPICLPSKQNYRFVSDEGAFCTTKAKAWMNDYSQYNLHCGKRYCSILMAGPNGKQLLINRFLRKQCPPNGFDTMYQCAHYVSLIPFLKNWESLQKEIRVKTWSSSQLCLNLIAGDWEEHAALLANYFMYIGREYQRDSSLAVFLVFGFSIAEGNVIYVLTKEERSGRIQIWNPATGVSFEKDDEHCPLLNIGLLVTQKNMYANIQDTGRVCLMDFNLQNKASWRSYYSNSHESKCYNSIQEAKLNYTEPNISLFRELTIDVSDAIKVAIRGWRRLSSSFDRDISNRLEHILDDLEEEKKNYANYTRSTDCIELLQSLLGDKKVFGFPLHQRFTNIENIVKAVERTRIHDNKHPDVQFAVAVKIFPYPCDVASVWIFLCSITPG